MLIKVDMRDVGLALDLMAEKVGETTEQATLRLGVAVARIVSADNDPKETKAGTLKAKTAGHMKRVVEPVPQRFFAKLKRGGASRQKLSGRWVDVRPERMVNSAAGLWRVIERNRGGSGKTKDLPDEEKFVCSQQVFNETLKRRMRLWGVGRGSWLGAGAEIARMQRGLNRNTIGKNHPAIAKRHMNKGRGYKSGRGDNTTVWLTNKAGSSRSVSAGNVNWAVNKGRRAVWAYYRGELRRMSRR